MRYFLIASKDKKKSLKNLTRKKKEKKEQRTPSKLFKIDWIKKRTIWND